MHNPFFLLININFEQLQEEVRTVIFGNVLTLICFRVRVNDAEYLEKEVEPVLDRNNLIKLPRFGMYSKLMINSVTTEGFSGRIY